jgi:hypothetical protein
MDVKLIVLICTVSGMLVGAVGMWGRVRLKRQIREDRARLNEHLASRGGRNVVGGPRWGGFPPTDG